MGLVSRVGTSGAGSGVLRSGSVSLMVVASGRGSGMISSTVSVGGFAVGLASGVITIRGRGV